MVLNFIAIIAIFALDQITKYLTVAYVKPAGTIPLIDGVLHFTYAQNTGAAFSMLEGKIPFFIVLTIAAVIAILYFLYKKGAQSLLLRISLIFIAGGALGNLCDRIRLSYVVDMIDFRLIHFAIFNVADSFAVIGTILLIIYFLFFEKTQSR